MTNLLAKSTATQHVRQTLDATHTPRTNATPVLISEQQVAFLTAAAISVPAPARRRWLVTAISYIHVALPKPRPVPARHEGSYFETARLSREMDHL